MPLPEQINCEGCGADCRRRFFMCDLEPGDTFWCHECYFATPCGRGDHGEGCGTLVMQ
jgi:hypothetical protein